MLKKVTDNITNAALPSWPVTGELCLENGRKPLSTVSAHNQSPESQDYRFAINGMGMRM